MIRHAGPAKLAALSVALVLHGALAVALVSREAAEIEGNGGETEVQLGNAFSDMAAGTLTAERPDEAAVTAPDTPERIAPAQATAATAVPPIAPQPAAPAQPKALAATLPPALQPLTASTPETLAPQPVPERLDGAAPETAAVARSLRPKPRSATFEAAHTPAPRAQPAPREKQAAAPAPRAKPAQGAGTQNARAGETTGTRDATARQSGTGGRQQEAGNAAVSNYPGLVMRQLSRAGRPRASARGTAVVAFTIGGNGGLASVALASSSGSASLDEAALRLVRGAGPFPKPPQGARRSFSIEIRGR